VLFDIDDFKVINDQFGHLMGDRVLKDIGAMFLRRTRNDDIIARYGGDEFVLLVHNLTVEETATVAERLGAELTELQWMTGKSILSVGVTIGIACSALLPQATVEQLLAAADQEMYSKKWLKKHPATEDESPEAATDIVLTTPVIPEIKTASVTPGSAGLPAAITLPGVRRSV
jgi:diguanylate cyclase (GGDEF)-like protein